MRTPYIAIVALCALLAAFPASARSPKRAAADAAKIKDAIAALKGTNFAAKEKAFNTLMDFGPAARDAVPTLINCLDDRDELTRDYAISTLKKIGADSAPALTKLKQLAHSDPSSDIRQLARSAVDSISAAGPRDNTEARTPPPPPERDPDPTPNPNPDPQTPHPAFTPTPDPAPKNPLNPNPNPTTPTPPTDPFAGSFAGEKIFLDCSHAAERYSGTITFGEQRFPFTATLKDQTLSGEFTTKDGDSFPFTASVTGDTLTFHTGSTTHTLRRNPTANPLATPSG